MATRIAKFTVDSALLRELGERLVGQPHIALAELIKNAYDADATVCEVEIGEDSITVSDNGHGMKETEFRDNWMRIGTQNKRNNPTSRRLKRPLTGSKGVGRLSAQFLAHKLSLTTSAKSASNSTLEVDVNWDKAIKAGDLTSATAALRTGNSTTQYANGSKFGTSIKMEGLKQEWKEDAFKSLAREIWMLQPPIVHRYSGPELLHKDAKAFQVTVRDQKGKSVDSFNNTMKAVLENWIAKINGTIQRSGSECTVNVTVAFKDGSKYVEVFSVDDALIHRADWEIRIFNLSGRQGGGVKVEEARQYLSEYGGVQMYDALFRLPYYGVKQDWLNLEVDHSHRKNKSALLPAKLQVPKGLNDLPTQARIFGVTMINTSREEEKANRQQKESGDYLKIQVSRDRLVTNNALGTLSRVVRWSIDYYATRQAIEKERVTRLARPENTPQKVLAQLETVVDDIVSDLPKQSGTRLKKEISGYVKSLSLTQRADEATQALLGPLASAGMAAIAIEHEIQKEMRLGKRLVSKLRHIETGKKQQESISQTADQLSDWIKRLEGLRKVFSPMLSTEDRETIEALRIRDVVRQTTKNLTPLLPKVQFDIKAISNDVLLPAAALAEWISLFQNVFINASNAMLDTSEPVIHCSVGKTGRSHWIKISDTGTGIDLDDGEELFEPFARNSQISEERKGLGLGGMGLGLTIVRMIAESRHCQVRFVKPEEGYSTTFQMSWSA